MNHPVDRNKMVCRHYPVTIKTEQFHRCGRCRKPLKAHVCRQCGGTGFQERTETGDCARCGGTGVERWEVIP